jgi:digeranylgeranylglycerophospholipid reductase
MEHFDVIIVGAGPAGSVTAHTLAKNNISCAVFERRRAPGFPVCCGEAVSEASLKAAGLFHGSYIDKKIEGFRIFFPNGKYFAVKSPGCLINREKFDRHVFDLAVGAGAKPFLRHTVVSAKKTETGFEVFTNSGSFTCKYLVGADGPKSIIDALFFNNRRKLADAVQYKLPKPAYRYDSGAYIDFFYDHISGYYMWLFDKSKEINAGGCVADKELLRGFIKKHLGVEESGHIGFCRGAIPSGGIKDKIFNDNVFLVGDAAGLVNPVTLAGIHSALLSGKICAYCIFGEVRLGKKESPAIYEKVIKKQPFASKELKYLASRCFTLPESVLNFLGEYFDSRDNTYKNPFKFIKLAFKYPAVPANIKPLFMLRKLLKTGADKLW